MLMMICDLVCRGRWILVVGLKWLEWRISIELVLLERLKNLWMI